MSKKFQYEIKTDWEGNEILDESKHSLISFSIPEDKNVLVITVESAPFYNNPPPPKSDHETCICLWEFEVIEVFVKGRMDKYIEIELSPHGEYLILAMDGHKQRFHEALHPISYKSKILQETWTAEIVIPFSFLPPPFLAGDLPMFSFNAYSLYSQGDKRITNALFPCSKGEYEIPDCDRLHLFQPLPNDLFAVFLKQPSPEKFVAESHLWNERLGADFLSRFVP
jgi:hypothetical protein